MNWFEMVATAGSKHGISVSEFIVLDEVRMGVPLPPNQMARFLIKERDHLEEVRYTEADYEVAIENCIEKGWLQVLSEEDVAGQPPSYSTYR